MIVDDVLQTYGPDDGGPPMGITWTVEPLPKTRWWQIRSSRVTVEWNGADGRRSDTIDVPRGYVDRLMDEVLGSARFGNEPNLDLQYQTLVTL